jgi:YgiT-type zinc finger domain-containing protein
MNNCPVCKNGELKKGTATVKLERGETIVIFKKVPAEVCNNCGSYFLDEKTSEDLFKRATDASVKGAELEIMNLT